MKKINKICNLSTIYKQWETTQTVHPKYNSKFKFYGDVIMQLFKCQDGLCAYTEQELCDESLFLNNLWENGRYRNPPKENRFGELEHFDSSLKATQAWLWDNLFMVDSVINNRKGTKPVDDILKPDRTGYNPFELMDYDIDTHIFLPNQDLEPDISERVKIMINTLRINDVSALRRKFLRKHFNDSRLGSFPFTDIKPEQFPTSFQMCVLLIHDGKISLEDLTK